MRNRHCRGRERRSPSGAARGRTDASDSPCFQSESVFVRASHFHFHFHLPHPLRRSLEVPPPPTPPHPVERGCCLGGLEAPFSRPNGSGNARRPSRSFRTRRPALSPDKGFRDGLQHPAEDPPGIDLFGVVEWTSFAIRLVDKWVARVDRQTPRFSTNSATNIHALSLAE